MRFSEICVGITKSNAGDRRDERVPELNLGIKGVGLLPKKAHGRHGSRQSSGKSGTPNHQTSILKNEVGYLRYQVIAQMLVF